MDLREDKNMTAMEKKPKLRNRRKKPPLPPESGVAIIAGREYLIAPLAEYDDWMQDRLLAAVAFDRLENNNSPAIPFDEMEKRLDRKRRG
jgi:hypothetical protein